MTVEVCRMLQIIMPASEQWDEFKSEFVYTKEQSLQLEHSLVSLSKWEAKQGKPFLTRQEKTFEETVDYIKCMTLTKNVSSDAYRYLTDENIDQINSYIEAPMTATYFSEDSGKTSKEQVTAELIYYWMIALNIPFECQKWHLNRLLTLIKVCNIKNQPPKKRSMREIMNKNAALNEARRKQLNTKG
jgi:hypothetical protein